MSALASLERFGKKDPFSKNEDRADTVYKVNGLQFLPLWDGQGKTRK